MNNYNSRRPKSGQGGQRPSNSNGPSGQNRKPAFRKFHRETPEDRLMAALNGGESTPSRQQAHTPRRTAGQRQSYQSSQRPKKTVRRGQYINPSKFVNKTVVTTTVSVYEPTHVFNDFPLNHKLQANIVAKGYTSPSAIQDQAIPPLLEGKDVIGLANTGTGKTAAFLIPAIQKLMDNPEFMSVLIITPTRELATQIDDEFRSFTKDLRLFSTVCVGGTNIVRQIKSLKRRPHVVIGTPGRLKDLMQQKVLKLDTVNTLVLDEADRMCDMGVLPDITSIIREVPKTRQSMFFSATMTPTISSLIMEMMKDPITVSVVQGVTSDRVYQDVIHAHDKNHKIEQLTAMLADSEFEKVLVFGETKYGVQRLAETLTSAGHTSEAIHGNKSQSQRQRALDKFKANSVKVLVATDVAARGLDIPNVSHVINFDQPHTYDDYVHRIGRTGRGGATGKAYTFVDQLPR